MAWRAIPVLLLSLCAASVGKHTLLVIGGMVEAARQPSAPASAAASAAVHCTVAADFRQSTAVQPVPLRECIA